MLIISNLKALSNELHGANCEIFFFITLLWDISMLQLILIKILIKLNQVRKQNF